MAWTTPATWSVGEVVTASKMNIHVRDNFSAVLSSSTTLNSIVVAASLTTLKKMVAFDPGEAVTAASYQVGRDADGTNQLHFNVPTGASFEFSINDVAEIVYTTTALAFQQATTISTTSGDLTLSPNGVDVIVPDDTAFSVGSGADSRIYYDGTDTFWHLRAVGTGALMLALAGSFPSPDGPAVHIWNGTAGVVVANDNSRLVVESSDSTATYISILTPNNAAGGILFGEPASNSRGQLIYTGSTDTPADTFRLAIAGNLVLDYSANTFAFQEATDIDLQAGSIQLIERTAPGAGAANTVRIYAVVDGGSLTDLAAVFQDGTVDIFAQEV